jgi:adenylate cyclase
MTTRRLAAILAADVVGFSTMMEKDEERTLKHVKAFQRDVIEPKVKERGGRLVKTTGDGFLCEFGSPVEAVRCALEVQQAALGNGDPGLLLRMGINLGDIIVEPDGDIYGDGVNVAARLEQLSEPGGLCISGTVHDQIEGKLHVKFESRGERQVKNIARPVRVYAAHGSPSSAHRKSLSTFEKPSIAVLPFQNMSGDPEQEYFADGISEDLLTALSRLRWLTVIARNSSFVFKGRSVDVKDVGARLGVRFVLEGSTRRAANRVRITAQLIETATGAHVWADRYDSDYTDIFALQDRITASVVAAVEPNIRTIEIARARAKRPDDLNAYDLFLRALPEFYTFSREGFQAAERLLTQALQLDANYAEAWAALADCIARQVAGGWLSDWQEAQTRACEAAENAVKADADNANVLAISAFTIAMMAGQLDHAVHLARRALQLNPHSASVLTNCGWVAIFDGDYAAGLEHLREARRLSPIDPRDFFVNNAMSVAHFHTENYAEAERLTSRTLEQWPHHLVALKIRAASLVWLGRAEEAEGVIKRLLRSHPSERASMSKRFPYRKREGQQRMIEALLRAGLPE